MIGIGYILVASIILLNYIAQRSEIRQAKVRTLLSGSQPENGVQTAAPDMEILQKQLDEERRVRREMTEMLNRLQRGNSANSTAGAETAPSEESARANLPLLREGLLSTETRPIAPPPSGRNPFLPFFSQPSNPVAMDPHQGPTVSFAQLRSNPVVPLPLTGSWLPIKVYDDTN